MIPHRTPFFLPYIYSSLTWRLTPTEKKIYLTFDDGPIPGPTDYVLTELSKRNAKATFFCIGDNVRKHPGVLKAIVDEGHAVGNHTYNHLNGWKTSDDVYLENVRKCNDMLLPHLAAGTRPLFRPPYGKIRFSQIRRLRDHNIVMWDVLTKDYDQSLNGSLIVERCKKITRFGSIVVFHDSFKAESNLRRILPAFMDHFVDSGFAFCAIT